MDFNKNMTDKHTKEISKTEQREQAIPPFSPPVDDHSLHYIRTGLNITKLSILWVDTLDTGKYIVRIT